MVIAVPEPSNIHSGSGTHVFTGVQSFDGFGAVFFLMDRIKI
jgi:5-keto 4-deoxyuronate isomerase